MNSVTPVQVLLPPRDYLASFLLFAAIAIGVVSIVISAPTMQAEAFNGFNPLDWPAAGPMWPMLFVTIGCGAILGFHSAVSSGTTCKQIDNESHACRVGYGGMIVEGLVGALTKIDATTHESAPDWFLAAIVVVLITLAGVVFWEGVTVLMKARAANPTERQLG